MTRSASASIERSQFEAFLIAPIGLQQNGMLLSVLSALARLDIDPWHEAASLAKMSTEAATERMRLLRTERSYSEADLHGVLARRVNMAKRAPQRAARHAN